MNKVSLYLLPMSTRVPLKLGNQTLTTVTCARVHIHFEGRLGRTADSWGETPLSVQLAWPGSSSHTELEQAIIAFCWRLTEGLCELKSW